MYSIYALLKYYYCTNIDERNSPTSLYFPARRHELAYKKSRGIAIHGVPNFYFKVLLFFKVCPYQDLSLFFELLFFTTILYSLFLLKFRKSKNPEAVERRWSQIPISKSATIILDTASKF